MRNGISRSIAAIAAIAAAVSLSAPGAGALEHPDHDLADIGDGPASVDNGVDRGNPAGSNGTIKIDGQAFDGHPNNEPHIGNCGFEVDFYGFDEGDTAELTFFRWPGTGDKGVIATFSTDVGGDGAGGGIDIDRQLYVELTGDLGNFHPQHGYHIRAEAEITSGDRTYTKTKVFWLSGDCDNPYPDDPYDT